MSEAFWISYGLLWFLVIAELAVLVALYQYIGNNFLQSRAGRMLQGPAMNEAPPSATLTDTNGREVIVPNGSPQTVFFATTNCLPCERLRSHLSARPSTSVVVVCQGSVQQVRDWGASLPVHVQLIADTRGSITSAFKVGLTPFGFSVFDGVVDFRGLASEPLAIERLLSPGQIPIPKSVASRLTVVED